MNTKPYFPYLYHYLFNHESIKSLSAIEKEIEILNYLKENKKQLLHLSKIDFVIRNKRPNSIRQG